MFTGYSGTKIIFLLIHIYGHYARILAMDLAANNTNLREALNPDEPLKRLYTRLNKCVDCATISGKPVTKVQVVLIVYSTVTDTGQFQEDYQIWRARLDL